LFFSGEDYKKIRDFECLSRFMAFEELKERGNLRYAKGKYLRALDFYERALSLFRWLEYHESPKSSPSQQSLEDVVSQSSIS
jgi:tetratricopeptide (TPR) repeat protein